MTIQEKLEKFVVWWLEDNSFEELLEHFDVTPEEAFEVLFKAGMIDEEELDSLVPTG